MRNPIPPQHEANHHDPEEHAVWALRNMPTMSGAPMITHSGYLRQWSKHLWDCGFRHRDHLERLADDDGNIHISKLPDQKLEFQEPFRGPNHQYNNAARWVPKGTGAPEPVRIPNIRQLTLQENMAMIQQYKDAGYIKPDGSVSIPSAAVVDRKSV